MVEAPALINIVNGSLCNRRKTTVKMTREQWNEIYRYIVKLRLRAESPASAKDPWESEFGT